MNTTTPATAATAEQVRTFAAFPGFTFHRIFQGFGYARNGRAKVGMNGNGTPRYTWTVRTADGALVGMTQTLAAAKDLAAIEAAS